MPEVVLLPLLTAWQNFYVIVGSASAALTARLMFVAITLSSRRQGPKAQETHAAFSTPNITHFGAALFVAAALSAPWLALWNVSIPLGLCGLAGTVYVVIVWRRVRSQKVYQPVLEDWLWHTAFPLASYVALGVSAIAPSGSSSAGAVCRWRCTVLLLFAGIHNAWDTVTYIALMRSQPENKDQGQ